MPLRVAGHDVDTVNDEGLDGHPDDAVIQACRHDQRILITLDLDFADLRSYPPSDQPGLIVLRLKDQAAPSVLNAMKRIVHLTETETVEMKLWILEKNRLRIRGD